MIVQEVQRFPAQMPANTDRSESGGAGGAEGATGPGGNPPGGIGQAAHKNAAARNPSRKRPMWPLYAIVLMSLAPVVAAVLAYFAPELGLRPEGHTNYGKLIQPQRAVPSAEAFASDRLGRPALQAQSIARTMGAGQRRHRGLPGILRT